MKRAGDRKFRFVVHYHKIYLFNKINYKSHVFVPVVPFADVEFRHWFKEKKEKMSG